jgi:radical SAM superfamily enzyme YgiQ (UPF0313 family)
MKYDFILFTDTTDSLVCYKPIGAYKCAYSLRTNGYSCLVVDHLHTFTQEELEKLLDLTVGDNTVGIGFSTTFLLNVDVNRKLGEEMEFQALNIDNAFMPQGHNFENNVIRHVKTLNPDCKIILGGTRAHTNIKNKLVDYVIIGYAETSIVNLADHLTKQEQLLNSHKNIFGRIIIDNKLAPDYDFKNSEFFWEDTDVINTKVLPLEISRGCIFKCKFCSYPLIGKKDLEYVRNIDTLRDELQRNYDRYGVDTYYILDDTFNDNEMKLDAILDAVKQLTFQPKFWAYVRLDLLTTRKNVDKLYEIGVRGFYFGIESMNPPTARTIGKGYDRPKQIEMIKYIREKYGDTITMHGSFIIGLPGETLEMVNDTHKRLLNQEIPLHTFRFNGLWLDREHKVQWMSEFSKNYSDYGYTALGPEFDDERGMVWSNELMDRDTAWQTGIEFNNISWKSDNYGIPGQFLWGLLNYGYQFNDLRQVKYKDINWNKIETVDKPNFINSYKEKLYETIHNKTL